MTAPSSTETIAGLWRVDPSAGKRPCTLALSNLGSTPVHSAIVENCEGGPLARGRQWRAIEDGFALLDSEGGEIGRFRAAGEDAFVSADGVYRLSRAPLA
jgi:hypothetical protein